MSKLKREFKIYPAWDKRNPNPHKNYGIHGCELAFYVHDARKSKWVQFKVFTCWLPKNVQEEYHYKTGSYEPSVTHIGEQPSAADLGYHSPKKMYSAQTRMKCEFRNGYCYYDGSGLNAERVRDILLKEGSDGVWKELEKYWHETFAPKPSQPKEGK